MKLTILVFDIKGHTLITYVTHIRGEGVQQNVVERYVGKRGGVLVLRFTFC